MTEFKSGRGGARAGAGRPKKSAKQSASKDVTIDKIHTETAKKLSKNEILEHVSESDIKEIIEKIVEDAKSGDRAAQKILLDRAIPTVKPQDKLYSLRLPKDNLQKLDAIVRAVSTGKITAAYGNELSRIVQASMEVTEIRELKEKLESLEEALTEGGN
jgi:16S rRNA C1402 N4-methylase RsmH